MTFAVFHDYPGLEYGLPKFHDFAGPVVTLYKIPLRANVSFVMFCIRKDVKLQQSSYYWLSKNWFNVHHI